MANETTAAVEKTPAKGKKYKVVGLAEVESMPIEYKGLRYDLANLSDAQVQVLLDTGCPYVAKP